jgi:hypothetical protein
MSAGKRRKAAKFSQFQGRLSLSFHGHKNSQKDLGRRPALPCAYRRLEVILAIRLFRLFVAKNPRAVSQAKCTFGFLFVIKRQINFAISVSFIPPLL